VGQADFVFLNLLHNNGKHLGNPTGDEISLVGNWMSYARDPYAGCLGGFICFGAYACDRADLSWELKKVDLFGAKEIAAYYCLDHPQECELHSQFKTNQRIFEGQVLAGLAMSGFFTTKPGVPQAEIDAIDEKISIQSQARHIEGTPQWTARGKGGYSKSPADAQAVLDAVKSGQAQILGRTSKGQLLVQYDGVTGFNNNSGAGFPNQPTNMFIVKGTSKVSVVPTSPGAKPQ
jgi:hypothetical protein